MAPSVCANATANGLRRMRCRFLRVRMVSLATALALGACQTAEEGDRPTLIAGTASPEAGFARALEVRAFQLPQDHGPHPDFQTEWWYYTGNLKSETGERFGFQLTFFRRGLSPGVIGGGRASGLATNQIYFAHFALTDIGAGEHHAYERFSRGAGDLAGASPAPFRVWLEDWSAQAIDEEGGEVRLVARQGEIGIELVLRSAKPIVLHGEQGLSRKSESPGNASYYLSYTRMQAEGSIAVEGKTIAVQGEGWFDHEWSTSALAPGAVGWDWFGLQLSDGRELMLARIRHADGSIDPVSGGTLVEADGSSRLLAPGDVEFQVLSYWKSPETAAVYPSAWRVVIPSAGLDLQLRPWLESQEMNLSIVYWEGAVKVEGLSGEVEVQGHGYVELTGYARSMEGVF
ncbi:MAG TPA: lipocalin-like domain-containing protein [Anaerolineales bacterium]|nr:lipocalin-like domain-containing protein [Anaerolineales bacterium]